MHEHAWTLYNILQHFMVQVLVQVVLKCSESSLASWVEHYSLPSLADRIPQRSAVPDVFTEDAADDLASMTCHSMQKHVRVCIPQIDLDGCSRAGCWLALAWASSKDSFVATWQRHKVCVCTSCGRSWFCGVNSTFVILCLSFCMCLIGFSPPARCQVRASRF